MQRTQEIDYMPPLPEQVTGDQVLRLGQHDGHRAAWVSETRRIVFVEPYHMFGLAFKRLAPLGGKRPDNEWHYQWLVLSCRGHGDPHLTWVAQEFYNFLAVTGIIKDPLSYTFKRVAG